MATYKPINVFEPLEWQVEPWQDKSPIMCLPGPAGSGKSKLAYEKVHAFAMKYPECTGLLMRKQKDAVSKSIIPAMLVDVIGDDPRVRWLKNDGVLVYDNGSMLFTAGMYDERQRGAVRSIGQRGGLDIVLMEEALFFTEKDFNALLARMRGRATYWYYRKMGYSDRQAKEMEWRQLIVVTNPGHPKHWIKVRLIDNGEATTYISRTEWNTHNPDDYVESNLSKMTGVQKKRLVDGLWVASEGAVYSEFRETPTAEGPAHMVEPFPIPADWQRYIAIDFGYTMPFVALWVALDHDRRMYVYRQIYWSQRIVEDHAKMIKNIIEANDEEIYDIICDHDAEDRATLEKYLERSTAKAYKPKGSISMGIQLVRKRLRNAGDGKPRLFILKNSLVEVDPKLLKTGDPVNLTDEMYFYVMPEDNPDGKPNELPIDAYNHAQDALRYIVMHLDRVGNVTIEAMGKAYAQMKEELQDDL